MAYVAPTSRADGYVVPASEWNQDVVDNPIALRAGGIAVASQAANDVFYASSATQLARLAAGTAGQHLQTNGSGAAPTWVTPAIAQSLVCGRLTLTSATPVTTTDVTAATTLYFALHRGNQIGLYTGTGSVWAVLSISELSIAVPATTDTNYDVFVDYNAGTPQLSLTAWTNATTRATALTKQDGILVKTGATGSRYVGSIRTTGVSGQCESSLLKRFVYNYYHQVETDLRVKEATNSWNYSLAAWQQANAAAANQVALLIGVDEHVVKSRVHGWAVSTSGVDWGQVAIGLDSTTTAATGFISPRGNIGSENTLIGEWVGHTGIGYHTLVWLESTAAGGTTTWYGDNNTPTLTQTGLLATAWM